ncbi:MAG: glycosyltransferase family 2 protein [Candidatus Shapirobacteria bacterium]|nr:glycosyltransferase family 2 protein [Candidatus Shapirobacteria bacterium]
MTKFSIIIPNYNGAKLLNYCLVSLKQSIINNPEDEFEIILVDNNSKDDSVAIFNELATEICLYSSIILNNKNFGFAKAVNQGILKAKYDYVVLLNNDITMNPDWFKLISQTIQDEKDLKTAVFFGTVLNKEGDKFESQGLEFDYSGKCQNISDGQPYDDLKIKNLKLKIFPWGSSAAFTVYKKDILIKIGLFDDDFFAYEEDVDISLRLHNLGYKTLYIPKAISYHLGGGTTNSLGNFRSKMVLKNWIYIIIKNYSLKQIIKNFPQIVIERLKNISYLFKKTKKSYGNKALLYFLKDFTLITLEIIFNLPSTLNKRQKIQKMLKSSQIHDHRN